MIRYFHLAPYFAAMLLSFGHTLFNPYSQYTEYRTVKVVHGEEEICIDMLHGSS